MIEFVNDILGLGVAAESLAFHHILIRTFIVYALGMILMRLQSEFMTMNTPFFFIYNFMMGSLLADAIIGEAQYLTVLLVASFLAFLNWILALLCYHFPRMESLLKGKPELLVSNGKILWRNMRKNLITQDELLEAIHRVQGEKISDVKKAYFEVNGEITVILK
jgi:uncharacterized membrane protein YcaP (DUF421 family)